MDTIEKVIDFLKQYPFMKYEHGQDAIRVFRGSEIRFEVALLVSPESYTVCFLDLLAYLDAIIASKCASARNAVFLSSRAVAPDPRRDTFPHADNGEAS
jgi:hypothetical protein